MDRAWIQWGSDPNYRFTNAYKEGVNSFLEVAKHHVNANNQISCPCMKCNNTNSHPLTVVKIHLLKNGMVTTYNPWIYHGEQNEVRSQTIPNSPVDASEHNTGIFDMMNDRPERNQSGSEPNAKISVFAQRVRPTGKGVMVELSQEELKQANWFILNNCDEIEEFRSEYVELLKKNSTENIDQRHMEEFQQWFLSRAKTLYDEGLISEEIYSLAHGADPRSVQYTGCMANDIRWSVKRIEQYQTTQDSGIMTIGSHNGEPCTFYGSVDSVVQFHFRKKYSTILFKCQWYNSDPKKMKFDYHLTSLNVKNQWYQHDPYVLAKQAHKVFYLDDMKLGHPWKVVQKIQYRHLWDVPEREEDEDLVGHDNDLGDEDDDANIWEVHVEDDETSTSLRRHDVELETIILNNTNKEKNAADDGDFIDDDSTDDDLMLEHNRALGEEELLGDHSDTNSD